MAEVFLLLGGNVGDKHKIFAETRIMIDNCIGNLTKRSSIYATEPWGFKSELFWNQVLVIETSLLPLDILDITQSIEKSMGRIKTTDIYESRTMDIDLLFYDGLLLDTPRLTLPHPKIAERKFVLVPMNEIVPEKRHPQTGQTIGEMLKVCKDPLKVDKLC
ncbi:MAG: 2-amino-4-hydroxy-6-hydroxymethyldihydropteridine diphosphokinase [Mariniphaga sp.]